MATHPHVPLLDFSVDTAPRQIIRIDNHDYQLRRNDDLSIDGSMNLGRKLRGFGELVAVQQRQGKLNKVSKERLGVLLKEICAAVLDAPPRVQRKLTPVMRFRIVNVFLMLSLTTLRSAKATVLSGQVHIPDARLAGMMSSLGSAGSTAATRSRGGRATRSA
jgi:hypothetical protein